MSGRRTAEEAPDGRRPEPRGARAGGDVTSAWDEHVGAALLGTRRRPVPALPPDLSPGPADGTDEDEDAAWRLLQQAAVLTVARRAGRRPRPAQGFSPVAPCPAESAPVVPPPAARRLELILARSDPALLAEWLETAAARGYRAPAGSLPRLLDLGRNTTSLRPAIAKAVGRRGVWLALHNTDWAYLVGMSAEVIGDDPRVWRTGTRNERVAYLTRLRRRDPEAAAETLRATWTRESAPDRAAFLAVFEHDLSDADEEFLEEALDDRGKDVRRVAADLLARLPGSAYGRRMAERARRCVRPHVHALDGRRRIRLLVEPPERHDEDMARDGIPFHPPGSFTPDSPTARPIGARAGWLREILARTPLAVWTDLLDLPPEEAVRLPVADARGEDDERAARDLHAGWTRAVVWQRDVRWARALLGDGVLTAEEIREKAELVGVLPAQERAATVGALLRRVDRPDQAVALLERVPGPWTGGLAEAVLTLLSALTAEEGRGRDARRRHREPSSLCELAAHRLAPDAAPRVRRMADARPGHRPLARLARVLGFRDAMARELT
ncbi:DUF5691 domain-containing protein [Thermomonospora catenispora]|uniref:DUF5691 domain-containing protein n=1 Tax=Thermomonospora catenispora TaxID=2493090 RepID=UPI00111FB6BB|nr:DUF5691 domain-containing protein [Thermomonospora catenispora]TNY37168.1 hypothetical protein EIO00_10025 [Thermomonospora catenispora]